ncbi:MAG TPA: hypothetical protein VGA70_00390 [Longimicrobiales bacterium]|jgi:hypothetical protein
MSIRFPTSTTALALALSMGLALAPHSAEAQRGVGVRGEVEQRVRARFGEMVRQRLQLTPEAQEAMSEVLQDFQERREALALREAQLRRRVQGQGRLGRGGSPPPLTDEEAVAILDEMAGLRAEESDLAELEQERLLAVLTPTQLLRYYAMRDQLAETVRRLQAGGPGGGMRRGGGGGLF